MAVADGGMLVPAKCLQPKADAEIAFVLGADLPSPGTTPDEVAKDVATVHAAIEIVGSRIADWRITSADTVADNGSSAVFVLADKGLPLAALDLERRHAFQRIVRSAQRLVSARSAPQCWQDTSEKAACLLTLSQPPVHTAMLL